MKEDLEPTRKSTAGSGAAGECPLRSHYLLPGALFADREPHLVTTIVGSCVAVCLWDPAARIGGINHFLLPLWNGAGAPTPKYGNVAVAMLIEKLQAFGSSPGRLQAKLFGGASLWESRKGFLPVGEKNIEAAYEILGSLQIPVAAADVGGKAGRKIVFNSGTGEVLVRRQAAGVLAGSEGMLPKK